MGYPTDQDFEAAHERPAPPNYGKLAWKQCTKIPKIITLCGSSRFVDIMAVQAWELERDEGAIVMGLHLLPYWYVSPNGGLPTDHLAEHEDVAEQMDELHLRKINLAEEIFVINVEGYVGNSTQREIAYAMATRKKVRFLDETAGNQMLEKRSHIIAQQIAVFMSGRIPDVD